MGLMFTFAANPLVLNDDCQTALEVARAKGNSNVVRTMEVAFKLFECCIIYHCVVV